MATTLLEMRSRVRQRADCEQTGNTFITDTELTGLINVSYKDLYATLVQHSLHKTESVQTITADGSADYDLNADVYSILNVYSVSDGTNVRLTRHSDRMRPGSSETGTACSYRVRGSQIVLYPTPTSGTYLLEYIPIPGDLSGDADLLDGVLGWEEYVVLDAAIKCLLKEESDVRQLQYERDRILQRIIDAANIIEFSDTRVVEDVYRGSSWLEGDWWPRRGYRGRPW